MLFCFCCSKWILADMAGKKMDGWKVAVLHIFKNTFIGILLKWVMWSYILDNSFDPLGPFCQISCQIPWQNDFSICRGEVPILLSCCWPPIWFPHSSFIFTDPLLYIGLPAPGSVSPGHLEVEPWGWSLRWGGALVGPYSAPSWAIISSRGTHLCHLAMTCNSGISSGSTWRLATLRAQLLWLCRSVQWDGWGREKSALATATLLG